MQRNPSTLPRLIRYGNEILPIWREQGSYAAQVEKSLVLTWNASSFRGDFSFSEDYTITLSGKEIPFPKDLTDNAASVMFAVQVPTNAHDITTLFALLHAPDLAGLPGLYPEILIDGDLGREFKAAYRDAARGQTCDPEKIDIFDFENAGATLKHLTLLGISQNFMRAGYALDLKQTETARLTHTGEIGFECIGHT